MIILFKVFIIIVISKYFSNKLIVVGAGTYIMIRNNF